MTPKNEKFWQTLLRSIEWKEGFGLSFLFYRQSDIVVLFRERLSDKFPDFYKFQRISPVANNQYHELADEIIKQLNELSEKGETTHAPIWIELDRNTPNETLKILFANLNGRRELLRNHLHRPLTFILPSGYKQQLIEFSPDLWAIRDYTFNLGDLEEEKGEIKTEEELVQEKPLSFIQQLKEYIYLWLSRFHHYYNQHVIYEHRVFNVRGLRTMGTFTLELQDVFIELRIAPSTLEQLNIDPISDKKLANNHPVWDFLGFKKSHHGKQHRVLSIIGAPGCGKTTLLQHIALTLAHKKQSRYGLPTTLVPLLLFLRNHVKPIIGDNSLTLAELAQEYFTNSAKKLSPPQHWFKQQLDKGKCLVLLDGLDEIAERQQRQKVSAWVDQQIAHYAHCHFIITSRPQGYRDAPLQQALVLEVQPFNQEQVKRFIHAWYLANEVTSFGGKIDDGVRYRARDAADDLIHRLQASSRLTKLTVNPLLLTMIATVHRYRGQLPGRRVELYAEICDVLLGHWREAIGIRDNLTATQKRVVLQPLAAAMMEGNIRDIAKNEAMSIMLNPLKRVGLTGELADNFLSDVQASSGLLLEREANLWSFAHLTFQEYLAAAYFSEQKTNLHWEELVNDSWWNETLLLYAAQGDATRLVQACLDNDTVLALTLASECLEEARELDATVRRQVEARISDGLESDDTKRYQLAAEVRLSQRLNSDDSLQRIDEQYEIDLKYITSAEYQLFLEEKRIQGEYYQPDHWTKDRFAKGTAKAPITGIRAEDAKAFCQWLTQRKGGGIRYRLPTLAELKEYSATEEKRIAVWYQENGSYNLYWQTENEQQNIIQQINKLFPSDLPFPIDEYFLANNLNLAGIFNSDLSIDRILESHRRVSSELINALIPNQSLNRNLDSRDTHDDRNLEDEPYEEYRLNALSKALGKNTANDTICKQIQDGDFQAAQQEAQKIQAESEPTRQRLGTLLCDMLACPNATTQLDLRHALRKYTAQLAKYIWQGYEKMEEESTQSGLLKRHQQPNFHEDKQNMLNIYWWLQILIAREEGKLPAWEGIRIVRESIYSE